MINEINTVDLFCGAGGATTGLELALKRLGMKHKGLAINHWQIAVETMKENHPDVDTKRMSIEEAVPAELVPSGEVDLLWASPSCTHHSRAKGGKPRSNQLRAQPELILTWLDQLFVRRLIVENVPEFVEWGPLNKDGKPIKSMSGKCFEAWVNALRMRNYDVDWRVVNCADYGDATTRKRFFLKAVRKGCGRITWPEAEYAENPQPELFGTKKPWRGIKECLDFSDTGKSIFNRKKPLAKNTLRRIEAGLRKFCGMDFQMDMLGAGGPDDCRIRSTEKPIPTQHCANRTAIVRPFIVKMRSHANVGSVDSPLTTISCGGIHHALCQPFVIDHTRNGKARSVNKPIPSQTTKDHVSMITPLVLGQHGAATCRPVCEPCPTVATKGAVRLITPLILGQTSNMVCETVERPCHTITTQSRMRVITPIQLDDGRVVDIRIRMLKPSELAAAHSFPKDYVLTGNRGDQVKQIGNSVPVMTAAAMCECDLRRTA